MPLRVPYRWRNEDSGPGRPSGWTGASDIFARVSASRRPSEPKPSDQRGTTPAPRPLLSTGAVLALCAVLAASTGLLHYQLIDLPNYRQQVNWHFDIVTGKGPYPDQYRLLSYFVAYGLMILGVPFAMAHVLVRFVFTATSLFVFHRYLSGWVRPPWALLGLFMLAAVLPLSFLFYFMQPTDPLNMLVFFGAFWALQRERDGWLIPLVVVGTLNRETALLLPLLHALVRWGRAPLARWLPLCLISAGIGAGIYVTLRMLVGLKAPYAPTSFVQYWAMNAGDPLALIQLLGFFNLGLWLAWRDWRSQPEFLRRAAWIVPVFFAIHFSVGKIREIRLFLPLLAVVIPLTLLSLGRRAERR